MRNALAILGCLFAVSCGKVPIYGVNAFFTLADGSWFAEEQTLFVFYELSAEQGLGDPSVIEITYATDEERVPWTPVSDFDPVHTHIPVDCGVNRLCGSVSISVPLEPRDFDIRLRYHRDGELALEAEAVLNIVGPGAPHTNRSLVVYGVFEGSNQQVQWRGRHQFPTLRNQQVDRLGLRRDFLIRGQRFGTADTSSPTNPYGYGVDCPDFFVDAGLPEVGTDERAVFDADPLPLGASEASAVCADATVFDATGSFSAVALARKNPEVRGAFPVLRSPVHEASPIQFFFGPCDRVISAEHEAMQRQRLLAEGVPTYCIDDWASPDFVDTLVVDLRDAVEARRPLGEDMVLVVGINQDEPGAAVAIERALAQVVPGERERSTPRLAGAFVFDSTPRGLSLPELAPVTLWCPATLDLSEIPDASVRSCPTLPDIPDLELGPFSFGFLPILPSREQYLDFIDTYSTAQAGRVDTARFLTPEFAATSDHVDLGEFGVVTFLNGESISAGSDDAFSYCVQDQPAPFFFRSELLRNDGFGIVFQEACQAGVVPPQLCAFAGAGLLPIELLPMWHEQFGERNYELGLFWEFPFLLQAEYEAVVAGAATAFGVTVPFGVADPQEAFLGSEIWENDSFALDPTLTQCTRFCDHPTFDSAGVYNVTDPFRSTYAQGCYLPRFPVPGDPGFPIDP